MAINEEQMLRELLQTFHIEASEHIQVLNQGLLQLERRPGDAARKKLLQSLFRAAHSLKGAARAVSLSEIESLAHSIESVLETARKTNEVLPADVCDALYDRLDSIEKILSGHDIDPQDSNTADESEVSSHNGSSLADETPPQEPANEELDDAPENSASAIPAEETIRVSVTKLDDLMAQTGELLVSKISAEQHLLDMRMIRAETVKWPKVWREIKALLPRLEGDNAQRLSKLFETHLEHLQAVVGSLDVLDQKAARDAIRLGMVTDDLQDKVRRVRMVPFQSIVLGLERAVRDAARLEDKQVAFVVAGADVELDKKVLETLKAPLLHLLRNAVGHGIESSQMRQAAGKPAEGRLTISVRQRGSEVHISVKDDGRGFDLDGLRRVAASIDSHEVADTLGSDELISMAFQSGVTTATAVTPLAGRGVGLDVVRQELEGIQGRIAVNSKAGAGASFDMIVPTTLAMTRGLMVAVAGEHYILPLLSIEKIVPVEESFAVGGSLMINVDESPLPLVALSAILERPLQEQKPLTEQHAIVIGVSDQRLALLVDDVLTEQELAVKPLGMPLKRVRNLVGAALLGNGEPVIILNPVDLVKSAGGARVHGVAEAKQDADDQQQQARHILVVDDSITTRTLEKNILETSGYRVTTATDGIEALQRLEEHDFDLIISDIEMPQMDGFELTRQLRDGSRFSALPIILVTSLESEEYREQGLLAGADAYIVKRGFDQDHLLQTIEQFLI